jgi:hypothetical protein
MQTNLTKVEGKTVRRLILQIVKPEGGQHTAHMYMILAPVADEQW